MVTTIAGIRGACGRDDGPVSCAMFAEFTDLVVAPNGVLFVAEAQAIRRISAAKRVASLSEARGLPFSRPNHEECPV
jgi:hypothetical protein